MLSYIYDFIYNSIWLPLFDDTLGLSLVPTYSVGGLILELPQILSLVTCIILGSLIIYVLVMLLVKCFKWFFGLIGR